MWTSIPPTAPGDYCASVERDPNFRRAWSGSAWSAPWFHTDPEAHRARARATPAECPELVEWLDGALVAESSDGATVAARGTSARGPRACRRVALAPAAPLPVAYALH